MAKFKIGLIVECAPQGMEAVLCPKIIGLLGADNEAHIEYEIRTLINKKLLIEAAAATAKILLAEGCCRVVVLWDENPGWDPEKSRADEVCWHKERRAIQKDLDAKLVDANRVKLVCIEREFETWLFYDPKLINDVMSSTSHDAKYKGVPDPLRISKPKTTLISLFKSKGSKVNPTTATRKFADGLSSLDQLKRCDTFRRFAQCVLGEMPKGWKPYEYKPKGPNPPRKQGKVARALRSKSKKSGGNRS